MTSGLIANELASVHPLSEPTGELFFLENINFMHTHHNRTVNISKQQLINKLKENKATHVKEYEEAVEAFKVEAARQIKEASKSLKDGEFKNVRLNLTLPVNRAEEYDRVIEMFNWETSDQVNLTQDEFNEYVHDDNDRARSAKMSNSFYSASFK